MIVQEPLYLHPENVEIDHRRHKAHRRGLSSILVDGSGIVLIKNRCHRRRLMRVCLAVYDYEDIHQYDNFLLSVPKTTTVMLPFEHPDFRPLSVHIYYPGIIRGLRVCVLARIPGWGDRPDYP